MIFLSFSKLTFSKHSFRNTIRVSKGLIWVQTVCKGYQQKTQFATSRQRVKIKAFFLWTHRNNFYCYMSIFTHDNHTMCCINLLLQAKDVFICGLMELIFAVLIIHVFAHNTYSANLCLLLLYHFFA